MVTITHQAQGPFTTLYAKWVGDGRWELTEPLRYFHRQGLITVPAGFVTDLDSVPRIPGLHAWLKGRATRPAVVHDRLYRVQAGRAYADTVFLDAMRDTGVPWYRRWPIYLGVRTWGWRAYRRYA